MIDRKVRHPPEVRGREMELVHEGHCEDEKAAGAYKASEGRHRAPKVRDVLEDFGCDDKIEDAGRDVRQVGEVARYPSWRFWAWLSRKMFCVGLY